MTKPHFTEGNWTGPFVLPDIREAVALDSDEKVFLYDLASHTNFTETGTVERVLQRTGFGRHVFGRVRKSLSALGLITVTVRHGDTWEYSLNVTALKAFPKARPNRKLSPRDIAAIRRVKIRQAAAKPTPPEERTLLDARPGKKNIDDIVTLKWPPVRVETEVSGDGPPGRGSVAADQKRLGIRAQDAWEENDPDSPLSPKVTTANGTPLTKKVVKPRKDSRPKNNRPTARAHSDTETRPKK